MNVAAVDHGKGQVARRVRLRSASDFRRVCVEQHRVKAEDVFNVGALKLRGSLFLGATVSRAVRPRELSCPQQWWQDARMTVVCRSWRRTVDRVSMEAFAKW